MKDCALIYPIPSQDSPNRNLALGIVFAGAALEQKHFDVQYIDLRFDPWDSIRQVLVNGIKILGVSAMTGYQCAQAQAIFSMAKQLAPHTVTILGGVHASMLPKDCLREPNIDFVVDGEGEETICELVSAILDGTHDFSGIKGIGWKRNGELVINEKRPFLDLGTLPFPLTQKTRRFFEIAARTRHLSYFTTRGCPFRCTFCYNIVFNRRQWRTLPIARLEEDLKRLRREVEFDHVYFVDDYLGHNRKRLSEVADTMQRLGISWHSSIRVNDIDSETATMFERGNCTLLLLGVESATDNVQQRVLVKDYRRGIEDVRKCVLSIVRTKIEPLYSFMYNVPGETTEDLENTFALAEWIYRTDSRARIGFYAYTPYPGTPLYDLALRNGFQPPKDLSGWAKLSLSNELNPRLRDLYYIAGLHFRGRHGDRTDENFPGLRRLQILPFEMLSHLRWKKRSFVYSTLERKMVRGLISRATRRAR
jgi:anaerobic magnesium-protoporphyrin IX monomethyl ester cyclase